MSRIKLNNQKMGGPGGRIKRLRKERGLTQTEFAGMIGRNFSTVSKLESGSLELSPTILHAICSVFGVRKDWLLHGTGAKDDDKWTLLAARAGELGEEVFLEFSRLKALSDASGASGKIVAKTKKAAQERTIGEECAAKLMAIVGADADDQHKAQAVARVIDAVMELLKSNIKVR